MAREGQKNRRPKGGLSLLARAAEQRAKRKQAADALKNYIEWVSERPSPHYVFRGQANLTWELTPTIGRKDSGRYDLSKELQMLTVFKRRGRRLTEGLAALSDWEWLAVAQHHGLPTRLLDWTTNALVAAYFATCSEPDQDGVVYSLATKRVTFMDVESRPGGPFGITEPVFFYPSALVGRIAAQRGLFSAHPEPNRSFSHPAVDRFEFRAAQKHDIRKLLHRMGVDEQQLMGGLDGLSATIAWQFKSGMALET